MCMFQAYAGPTPSSRLSACLNPRLSYPLGALQIPLPVSISALFLVLSPFCSFSLKFSVFSSPLCHLIRPQRCQLKFYLYCFRFRFACFAFWLLSSFALALLCGSCPWPMPWRPIRFTVRCTVPRRTPHDARRERIHPDVPYLCGAPSRISFKFELQQFLPTFPPPSSRPALVTAICHLVT